jgi:predicted amidophosphoribosyltransferase
MLDLLFPRHCMLCEKPCDGLCGICVTRLEQPCASNPPEGLDRMYGICAYEGAGRELVLALKRGNRRDGVPLLGASLAEAISNDLPSAPDDSMQQCSLSDTREPLGTARAQAPLVAGVTWAPTTSRRRRHRGYDQSQLLAAAVARGLQVRARRCLRRTGAAQMGLDVADRRRNPTFSPTVSLAHTPRVGIPSTWVLVDDVVTTGATMSAAAEVLRAAGADSVIGATIAITT